MREGLEHLSAGKFRAAGEPDQLIIGYGCYIIVRKAGSFVTWTVTDGLEAGVFDYELIFFENTIEYLSAKIIRNDHNYFLIVKLDQRIYT